MRGLGLLGTIEVALGAALVLLVVSLVLPGLGRRVAQSWQDPLLTFQDGDRTLELRPADGCLATWRHPSGRSRKMVLDYCAWSRPRGVDAWVPVTKELYRLDADRRHVVELVAFGLLPARAATVRYTLPGGEIVATAARRHADLDGPAYWIHLRQAAIPVDLSVTDGAKVFSRFQIFDPAGKEIPVV